jgi:sulfur-carrier protein
VVEVNLWSGLRRFADDQLVVAVEARTLREMFDGLVKTHPALAPVIKAGVSVSVNGVIETNLSAALPPDAEIYLIQRIKGG